MCNMVQSNLYESSNESPPVSIILENKFRPNVLSVNVLSAQGPVGQTSLGLSFCRSNVRRRSVFVSKNLTKPVNQTQR